MDREIKDAANYVCTSGDNKNYVIYSVNPFIIKEVETDTKILSMPNQELDGYHGSTNGIKYKDGYLFLIHKDKRTNRWLYWSPEGKILKFSVIFSFMKHSLVEFTCSLSFFNNLYYIGLGVNDNHAYIAILTSEEIEAMFPFLIEEEELKEDCGSAFS